MITSIASGDQWTYSVGPGASMAPGSGTPIIVNAATQGGTFSFEAGNGKCLSAQWTGSFDGTGILYACTPSANADASNGGVRSAKQMWILLPANGSSRGVANVGGGSLISKGSGSSGLSKKKKSKKNSHKKSRKGHRRKSGHFDRHRYHHHCRRDFDDEIAKRDFNNSVELHQLAKRDSGPFFICTTDHINDQPTRCVANNGQKGTGFAATGFKLAVYNPSDQTQMWTFRHA